MSKKEKITPSVCAKETKPKKKGWWIVRFGVACTVLTLRTFLFTVMLIFCLLAAVWILFLNFFNAQQISDELTLHLQKVFNRPVIISSIDLKFFNMLELKGFAVLDDDVAPGETVLSADSVTIRYKFWALLDRQLIVDEVRLNAPRINIVRGKDGRYNVPNIQTPLAGETSSFIPSGSPGKPWEVSIKDWAVEEGVLSYRDLATGVSHAVYDLNLHLERLRFNELSRFTVDTILRNKWKDNISDLEIKGSGYVNFANFNWSGFALRSFKTQVSLFPKPVDLVIDLDNLRTPYFNIKAVVPGFEKKDLSLFSPEMPDFRLPASTLTAKGVLSNNYSLLKLTDVAWSGADINISAAGSVDFNASPFTFEAEVKTAPFELKGKEDFFAPAGQFQLSGLASAEAQFIRQGGVVSMPQLDITGTGVSGLFYGFEAVGVNGEFSAKKGFSDLYAKTTGGRVNVAKTSFEQLNLTGTYRKGSVYAFISSALLNQVPLKLKLAINNIKNPNRTIETSIYLKHLNPVNFVGTVMDFVEVINEIPKNKVAPSPVVVGELAWLRNFRDRLPNFMPNLAGNLYADTFSTSVISGNRFNAEFDLKNLLPGAQKLDGYIDLKLEEGIIHQMEKLAEEQQALNITFTPFLIMHRMERSGTFKVGDVLKDVAFNELAISTDFNDGVMTVNNAYTQGPVISAAVSGWVNWVQESFDLIIWTMFSKTSRSGALAENLTDETGNPALAFKVSQAMLKPKVEMLRAKKAGTQIDNARKLGLRTDFKMNQQFVKGDFNAKK